MERFRRADYRGAAEAFARADDLVPSDDALTNAIAAARRANDHLVVVDLVKRALAREAESPKLAANAREALAQAERHLSRLQRGCISSAPCTIAVDGATVPEGTLHVLPGIHRVAMLSAGTHSAERLIETAPGVAYRVELEPGPKALPAPAGAARPQTSTPSPATADDGKKLEKPLPPAVFWAAVGVSGGLVAATTWSGLDALAARDDLPDAPTRGDVAAVEQRIVRTDVLLAVTAVVAAATTYAGLALVDWGADKRSAARPLAFTF